MSSVAAKTYSKIYLASQSPRRRELLQQLGVDFELLDNDFDESLLPNETPLDYVNRLAKGKAQSASKALKELKYPILSADTIVVLDGKCLGKPQDLEHAKKTLQQLSNRTHQVYTAVCLLDEQNCLQQYSQSQVTFSKLSNAKIDAYCQTAEPFGKAGSYAIQGVAASFIERIEGSYTGIVGLPLFQTTKMLEQMQVKYLLA